MAGGVARILSAPRRPGPVAIDPRDPPTLARDAARSIASGYQLASLDAFDPFPNTPHVEAVAVFTPTAR